MGSENLETKGINPDGKSLAEVFPSSFSLQTSASKGTWECPRGAMTKSQAKGMRHRDNKECQLCASCCGQATSVIVIADTTVICHLSASCNDSTNCPAKPSRRIIRA